MSRTEGLAATFANELIYFIVSYYTTYHNMTQCQTKPFYLIKNV